MTNPTQLIEQLVDALESQCEFSEAAGFPTVTARAALTAARAQPVSGWKLVPVEPTPEMNAAGYMKNLELGSGKRSPHETYKAMIAAAPTGEPE